jgi:hypothetical protein
MPCLVFCSRCNTCDDIPAFPFEVNIRFLFNVSSRCLVCNEQCHFIWKTSSENIFLINVLKLDDYLSSYEQENENIDFFYFVSLILQGNTFKQMYDDILTSKGFLPARNDSTEQRNDARNESETINQTNSTVEMDNEECSICLEEYENKEDVIKIHCNHVFHKTCLSEWEKNDNNTCPICRVRYVFKTHTLLVILSDGIGVILD